MSAEGIDICFDVETLGTRDSSIVLSMAFVPFPHHGNFEYQDLIDNSLFIKLDVKDQAKRGRTKDSEAIEWWKEQNEGVKRKSLYPSSEDINFKEAIPLINAFLTENNVDRWQSTIWTRGSLDWNVFSDLCKMYGFPPPFNYARIRDVRTAVDLIADTKYGYCETTKEIPDAEEVKHDPVHDCALDVMMLVHPKLKEDNED